MRKNSKHTPGPWIGGTVKFPDGHKVHMVTPKFGDPICTPSSGANARLIAAAPDMLEALENVVYAEPGRFKSIRCGSLEHSIVSAIRKAKGEAP